MTKARMNDVPTGRRHVVFWLASMTSFLLYLHRYTWNLIRPELQADYGFNNTTLEALGTTFYATYAFGSIPSGVVIDLFGPHLVLVVIVLVWSLTLPLHGVTANIYGLGGVRLLFGAAQTGAYPALGNVTRTWFPRANRTKVQGWVASFCGRGGGAVASILMGTVLMGWCDFSWRAALVVLSIPGVLFALVVLVTFRNSPEEDPRANEAERELIRGDERTGEVQRGVISTKRALQNTALRVMVGSQFLNAGADVVYTLVMGSFFVSLGVDDMKQLGWLVALPLAGGAIGGVTGGFLNDLLVHRIGSRWGRSLVGMSGKVIAAACLWGAISQPTPERVSVGLMFVKFFTDWTQPTGWGTCTDIGGRFAATVFSTMNMAGNAGALVMPLVFGPILDFFTTKTIVDGKLQTLTDFTPLFMLVGCLYVICGILWLFIDCTQCIDVPESANE